MTARETTNMPMAVTPGAVLGYAAMPQILPRIRTLFGTGFGFFAFVLAQIYRSVRLLPANHPYLNPANRGHFGFVQVIAAAANNLKFTRQNIDQVIVFLALLAAIVIIFLQAAAILAGIAMPNVNAADVGAVTLDDFNVFTNFFTLQGYNSGAAVGAQDIALIMLDRVFGVEGIFNSCISTSAPCLAMTATGDGSQPLYKPDNFPWPFHVALHSVFRFYSTALLVIAVLIFFYFIVVVVAETAQTGTPFGKRFNHVWAPLRLVVAFGLLIPIGGATGLNSAQYITLYLAKWGSNLASNGWNLFNSVLDEEYLGLSNERAQEFLAKPSVPEESLKNLIAFMTLARTCSLLESAYFPLPATESGGAATNKDVNGYVVRSTEKLDYLKRRDGPSSTVYTDIKEFTRGQDIFIRFGHHADSNGMHKGKVAPYCGEMVMPITDLSQPGANYIRTHYIDDLLKTTIWDNTNLQGIACYYQREFHRKRTHVPDADDEGGDIVVTGCTGAYLESPEEVGQALKAVYGEAKAQINTIIHAALQEQIEASAEGNSSFTTPDSLRSRGWAGAGIFYNRIATLNGSLFSSAWGLPTATMMPAIMEGVERLRMMRDLNSALTGRFDPNGLDLSQTENARPNDEVLAATLNDAYGALFNSAFRETETSGNLVHDILNILFGTEGLFNLRNEENSRLHPLAQLTGVGRSLIESTIQNGMLGMVAYLGGAGLAMGGSGFADTAGTLGGLFFTLASIGLVAGFILFYVVPFLPFLYFFFAVGNWIKAVFEAMVGVPLWALAHIRIDGNGLPGDAASGGYFLLLEILIRPILIVFGLIAGVSIFGALGHVLHDIYFNDVLGFIEDSAGVGAGAGDADSPTEELIGMLRSPVDDFFHLVMYAIIMYLLAMSSFKLIDLIPQQIMRWLGANVSSFGDQSMDAGQQLTQYAAFGGYGVFGQVSSAAQQLGGAGISLGRGLAPPPAAPPAQH